MTEQANDQIACSRCIALGSLDLNCPRCNGSGFVCPDCLGMGFKYNGAGLSPCACGLVAARERKSTTLSTLSALHGRLATCTFDGFDTSSPETQYASEAFNAAVAWAKEPAGFLTIHSPTKGNGKTHLAAAAANYLIGQGKVVLFCKEIDLLDLLRSCYAREDETVDRLTDKLRNVPILILDDLGTAKQTAWTEERMYAIIDHRLEMGLPVMFTTNCPLSELEGRIRSRITNRGGVTVLNQAKEFVQ